MRSILVVVVLIFLFTFEVRCDDFKEKLNGALKQTNEALQELRSRWAIDKFPNFLKSVAMTQSSWEVMKLKFESKIFSAISNPESPVTFVMSFMGSSVTAGHDTPFNLSFPILTGSLMEKPLSAVGIKVVSRNTALGNNPCLPYNLCPRTFSGQDADIVHWEQSYNCGTYDLQWSYLYEQFIRQSLAIPTRPIVVFSESSTPNWKEEDCAGKDTKGPDLSEKEKEMIKLLDSEPMKIPYEINKANLGNWHAFQKILGEYKTAGIQLWDHHFYQSYKCKGPYVPKWGCCSASWHPSRLGHELRAGHYAFYWLLIFRDALKSLLENHESIDTMRKHILKHIDSEQKHIPLIPLHHSPYNDDLQCYTTFEPIGDPTRNLFSLVIPGADPAKDFKSDIFENFIDKNIVLNAKKKGYQDFKNMLYGSSKSNPLSLVAKVKKSGKGFLCTPPGNWGKYPDHFVKFWDAGTKVFITENVPDSKDFKFDEAKARIIEYIPQKPTDSQYICVSFKDDLSPGSHVITIVPTTEDNIMISYLILP